MQKNGNVKPSASFLQSSHGIMFLEEAWSWLQVWTLCVCVHITMRIGMHDLFCERPFETRLFPWAKSIINSGSRGMTKKIKVAVEGIKLTTGFWRYRPKRLLFELASRKSRTLGVDQNFLIFWRPRCIYIYMWLPFHGKSYEQMDGLGVTPILGNLHIYI